MEIERERERERSERERERERTSSMHIEVYVVILLQSKIILATDFSKADTDFTLACSYTPGISQ